MQTRAGGRVAGLPRLSGARRRPDSTRPRSSFSACRRAAGSPSSAPSMRHSSSTSSLRPSRSTSVRATSGAFASRSRSRLTTRKWRCASDATCGRWVMQTTWRPSESARSRSPTARAVAPPTPASTSSKTTVPASCGGRDAHQREHDPRQLPARGGLAQRPGRDAGVGPDQELDRVAPRPGSGSSARRPPPRTSRPRAPARRAPPPRARPGSPRCARRASHAAWPPLRPAPRSRPRARCSSRPVASSAPASRSRSARQRSACSSTAAIVPPCFRFRRPSWSRRSSTAARRSGSASSESR